MKILVVIALIFLGFLFFCYPDSKKTNEFSGLTDTSISLVFDNNKPIQVVDEIKWKKWNRIREVSDPDLGVTLGDLESHISKDHLYKDDNKITWSHQVSHGINAAIRNKVYTKEPFNGFYVLQDRSILLREPSITIREIANEIPEIMRGPSFKIYLQDQTDKWNDRPLYLIDEWVAFTNGAEVGKELNFEGWYFELLQAHNFNIYCLYMAMIVNRDISNYRDENFKKFIKWNIERVFMVSFPSDRSEIDKAKQTKKVSFSTNHFCPHCRVQGNAEKVDLKRCKDYIDLMKNAPEAENLRSFTKGYFGSDWCKKYYGF